jgi:hypothetical protein
MVIFGKKVIVEAINPCLPLEKSKLEVPNYFFFLLYHHTIKWAAIKH